MIYVNDPLFANGIIGEGVAILSADEDIYAPISGVISVLYKTKHAIGITSDNGVELLIHIGIDTVRLDSKYFKSYVQKGERITLGQKLLSYNQKQVQLEGYDTTIMVIVTNSKKYNMNCCYGYDISEGEKIINIK